MFRKLLTGLVAAAGLTFAGASFAAPAPKPAPVAASSVAKPSAKKMKRVRLQKKTAAKSQRKLVKAQPRKTGTKMMRTNRKLVRAKAAPAK